MLEVSLLLAFGAVQAALSELMGPRALGCPCVGESASPLGFFRRRLPHSGSHSPAMALICAELTATGSCSSDPSPPVLLWAPDDRHSLEHILRSGFRSLQTLSPGHVAFG